MQPAAQITQRIGALELATDVSSIDEFGLREGLHLLGPGLGELERQ